MISPIVRVFISYSHDSEAHKENVRALADALNRQGVDAHIDAYETNPPKGWPLWMIEQIDQANFVLVVCTCSYRKRFMAQEEPGRGLGGTWEGAIITRDLYQQAGHNEKFIPIVFSGDDIECIPIPLQSTSHYDLSRSDGIELLYRRLTGQPLLTKPPIGQIVQMDPLLPSASTRFSVYRQSGSATLTRAELFREVSRLLDENYEMFTTFGPGSEVAKRNPLSSAIHLWAQRKQDTIIPNNRYIAELIDQNHNLLTRDEIGVFLQFRSHALAFAEAQRTPLDSDSVPLFPKEFRVMIEEGLTGDA